MDEPTMEIIDGKLVVTTPQPPSVQVMTWDICNTNIGRLEVAIEKATAEKEVWSGYKTMIEDATTP